MDIRPYLSPWYVTSAERPRLSRQPYPGLDPLTQDYAAWRLRSLRRSCLAAALFYALGLYTGDPLVTVRFGLRHPTSLEAWLEAGLTWYLRLLLAVCCLLLLASTWYWPRLRRSCLLARSAWMISFFGPMPLFLIPFPRVLEQHGADALVLASNVIRGIMTSYVPALFALLPALIRASLVLKRFLPESALPGVLVVVATPLQSLSYFLLLSILVQIVPNRDLVLGVLFLALAPLVWLARARMLIRPVGAKQGRSHLRFESLVNTGFTLIGISLVLVEVSKDAEIDLIVFQKINGYGFLRFLMGVLASRAILTVILVDGLLAMLFHAYRAERVGAPAETAERLGRRIDALGTALSAVGPPSTTLDGREPARADQK